jgi:hypothetical protein
MKTLLIYLLIMLAGDVTRPLSTNESLIEKCHIHCLFFNEKTQEDFLNTNFSLSIFRSKDIDFKSGQINNGPDKNKIVIQEEANGLDKSGFIFDSEKNNLDLALKSFIINPKEKSVRSRSSKMPVADISQRGIDER